MHIDGITPLAKRVGKKWPHLSPLSNSPYLFISSWYVFIISNYSPSEYRHHEHAEYYLQTALAGKWNSVQKKDSG